MSDPVQPRLSRRAWLIHASEVLIAAVLAYLFRAWIDPWLSWLGLGTWAFLLRWILLILFIAAAIRLHFLLSAFLKRKNILPVDDPW